MAGAESAATVTMEVLVEQHVVAPLRVLLEQVNLAEDGPTAIGVAQKDAFESERNFVGSLPQGAHLPRSSRTFNQKVVAVVAMELVKRFDEQEIDGKPDRTA